MCPALHKTPSALAKGRGEFLGIAFFLGSGERSEQGRGKGAPGIV